MAAGPGNLEVTVNGGRVPTAAAAQGAHTYAISFTPRDPRPHTVELRFNGDHVPGEYHVNWIASYLFIFCYIHIIFSSYDFPALHAKMSC